MRTVEIERGEQVWVVTIARPEVRNAVDGPTARALADAFRAFDADQEARVAILTGAGGHFCAGADLRTVANGSSRGEPGAADRGLTLALDDDMDRDGPMGPTRLDLTKPVIAAVEGYAVAGGLELALWCDLRIAAATATFGVFCRRFGVPLIDGGTQRLPRIVGLGRALDLILTGRIVETPEAEAMGLLTEVVPEGAHLERALEIAEALARFPQDTMLLDRGAAIQGSTLPLADGLELESRSGHATLETAWKGAGRFAGGEGRGGEGAGV